MAVLEHPLVFKVPAQTSRDTLRNKPTWFLVAEDDQGRVGVGECSLILGLSPETENVARTMLHDIAAKGVLDAMAVPASCPAVRFAVETAAWDLAQGGLEPWRPRHLLRERGASTSMGWCGWETPSPCAPNSTALSNAASPR